MNRLTIWPAACVALAAVVFVKEGRAQDATRLQLVRTFVERFDGRSPVHVSGNLIVGARLGDEERPFRPNVVKVVIPGPPRSGRLCLGVFSRDGRYAAENLYQVEAPVTGLAAFDFQSRHLAELAQYGAGSIATLIRDTPDCTSGEFGDVLPVVERTTPRPSALHVFINAAPERTSIELILASGAVLAGKCGGDREAPSLAFGAACAVGLGESPITGLHRLRIGVRERFDTAWREVSLRFDRP